MAANIKVQTTVVETTIVSDIVDLSNTDAVALAKQLADARELQKLAKEMEDGAKAAIEALMGDAKFGAVDGKNVFQRMTGKSTGVDREILKNAYPDALEAAYWEKPNHWFKVLG